MSDNKKAVHPLSRKAKKITKAGFRVVRKEKQVTMKNKEHTVLYQKVKYFQDKIKETPKKVYTPRELSRWIEEYINRNDDKLLGEDEIKKKVNRSNTADLLNSLKVDELKQFNGDGYSIPDLTKISNVKWLNEWEGNMQLIHQLQMKKFKSIDGKDDSEVSTDVATSTTTTTTTSNNTEEPKSIRTQLETPVTTNPFALLSASLMSHSSIENQHDFKWIIKANN
ncbi:UPF0534 protein [Heterostelium album PN500]|uniref:UPF0534 protein n=1 Tax=Heterostelium pallidum (strain ATCC 26659 / Pp 5 / PN500) TaxID=670386 RepID=D3B640_HETP5|nr:UPF0534 protein [Heterostelium album PN500]EFA83338.1 UPF0534 protein [Heterostelium album PN500]|eukprot:XP_020435455.1 UPF0534 protein [Heterostelium album PN500]